MVAHRQRLAEGSMAKTDEGLRQKETAPHFTERGRVAGVIICVKHAAFPNPTVHHLQTPKGGRCHAGLNTATQHGGHPSWAKLGEDGMAESPTDPRVV